MKMKKLILLLVLGILLTNFAYALDCQYRVNESYEEFELGLYDLAGEYQGPPLEFKEFAGGGMNIQGCNPPSFKVYNPTNKNFVLNISYQISWSTAFGSRSENHQTTISINKYSSSYKLEGSCPDLGSGSISEESIKYEIFEPEEIILKNEKVIKQREICKSCGNEICLNDGASCNPLYDESKCGSGVCNIAGFCGVKGTLKVVSCSTGKLNCNNQSCLIPSIKRIEESYSCEWECVNGTIGCDGICRGVSSKRAGQEYHCIEECASMRGNGKKCLPSKIWWIYFWIICITLVAIIVWYFAIHKRKKEEMEGDRIKKDREREERKRDEAKKEREDEEDKRDKAKEEYENLIVKKEETEKAIKENNKSLEDLKKGKEEIEKNLKKEKEKSRQKIDEIRKRGEEEIKKWEDKKKNKSIEAQKSIDEEIKKIRIKRKKEIDFARKECEETLKYLNYQIEKNKRLFLEKRDKENELREKNLILDKEIKEIEETSPDRKIKLLENKYKNEYEHGSSEVFYDSVSKYFKIKYKNGKIYDLHWKIYWDKINKNLNGKEIHHIDYDELNNELWNLIALPKEKHNKDYNSFIHSFVIKGDWESGIRELKRQLKMNDSDFPEHIRKELERRKIKRNKRKTKIC